MRFLHQYLLLIALKELTVTLVVLQHLQGFAHNFVVAETIDGCTAVVIIATNEVHLHQALDFFLPSLEVEVFVVAQFGFKGRKFLFGLHGIAFALGQFAQLREHTEALAVVGEMMVLEVLAELGILFIGEVELVGRSYLRMG